MQSATTGQSERNQFSLPLDIQTVIVRDHLIAEYRLLRARTYRVPASYDIRKKQPDRYAFGRYALVSSYWRALIQPVLFQKFHFEGLHNLRELQALCKQNPALATYTRELRVVSGDWEAPPKSILACPPSPNATYRRVSAEPTVLEQFSQAMWAMLQHWNSARKARGKSYDRVPLSLVIEFYISNLSTGLPKCFTPLVTGYADQKLEFLEKLEIKAHNVSKQTLRRMLPPVFYPAPLLPIPLAARELRSLSLRTEVLSEEPLTTTSSGDSDSDDGALVQRLTPAISSISTSALTQLLPRMASFGSLQTAEFELFVAKHLRPGAPDLLCRAVRDFSYSLTEFRAYISHISTEIFTPEAYDDEDPQDKWQDMKSYNVAFGDQDAWGEAYFLITGLWNTRSPRLERVETLMRAAVQQLIQMPKIEKWEVGCSKFLPYPAPTLEFVLWYSMSLGMLILAC